MEFVRAALASLIRMNWRGLWGRSGAIVVKDDSSLDDVVMEDVERSRKMSN